MKKHFLLVSLMASSMAFGQATANQSIGSPDPFITNPIPQQFSGQEIFRFRQGIVTQLQNGSAFDFTNSEWFGLGNVTSGSQTFYGLRFQQPNRGLTFGYTSASANNPRIEWIHNGGSTSGNLEFRTASNFSSGVSTLVASMTPQGNTYFGNANPAIFSSLDPKVGIGFTGTSGMQISTIGTLGSSINPTGERIDVQFSGSTGVGLLANVVGGQNATGLFGKADGQQSSIGVFGGTPTGTAFSAAIYGDASATGSNLHAGFFNGDVVSTGGGFLPSDERLKQNITTEKSALERISLLRPVSYQYKNSLGIALPSVNQHGFISQELAEVFPELTKDITQPIFDENGKINSEISYKAINYVGLISVLTAGIQELNTELAIVREELNEYKANDNVRSQLLQNNNTVKGYFMEQNTPNPFTDRTVIRYQLAPGVNQASITIFNLNGGFVKDYAIDGNKGEITVLASEIGKGMFIYSLSQNGQEMISKRMIVK